MYPNLRSHEKLIRMRKCTHMTCIFYFCIISLELNLGSYSYEANTQTAQSKEDITVLANEV